QVKDFENGKKLARFSLATTDIYKKDGKYVRNTQWHNVTAWNKTVDIILSREISTGSEIIVTGSIVSNSFTDKNGNERTVSEIVADSIMVRKLRRADAKIDKITA
ncbi:MAG: single-stranded DNA-binding protein, partial [Bacteroidales bacterium]|nr:single-stranded DNA-binding protein [Bacteroidales bacterium]